MSLVKIEEALDVAIENSDQIPTEPIQCCNKHFLVNSRIAVNDGDNTSYINIQDLNSGIELQLLRRIVREKDCQITNLERENIFLREQVRSSNILLDQLSTSTRQLANNKNDIRIKVENVSSLSVKKWYRRPKVILSGSAIAILFSIYLRYKIKNW